MDDLLFSHLTCDATSKRLAAHPSTPRTSWFHPTARRASRRVPVIAWQPTGFHLGGLHRPGRGRVVGWCRGVMIGDPLPRHPSSGHQQIGHLRLVHPFSSPAILPCPALRLSVGHSASQRQLKKRDRIADDTGFHTNFRPVQPLVKLRPAADRVAGDQCCGA